MPSSRLRSGFDLARTRMAIRMPSSRRDRSVGFCFRGMVPSACAATIERWKNASISPRRSAISAASSGSCGACGSGRCVAKIRRRNWIDLPHPSLSAGHLEVEQDRAPPVLPHYPELAVPPARRPHDNCRTDRGNYHRTYEKGIKVSDAEMKTLDITGDPFHPEWNYTILPRSALNRSG